MAASGDDLKSNFQVKKLARRQPEKRQMLFFRRQPEIRITFGCGGQKKARFCCTIGYQQRGDDLKSNIQVSR
jgi:hypothetical protein